MINIRYNVLCKDLEELGKAVEAGGLPIGPRFAGFCTFEDTNVSWTEAVLADDYTQAEKAIIDAAIANYDSLKIAKREKCLEIDLRTQSLIAQGFSYGGKILSLSDNAQRYYLGLAIGAQMLTYPITVNALNDLDGTVTLNSANEALACYTVAMGTVAAHLGSGTALKSQVRAATSLVDLGAITDSR